MSGTSPSRPLVYVAIPKYLHFAHQYILQYAIEEGAAPLTPYGITFWLLDTLPRDDVRDTNSAYVAHADEVWAFGTTDPTLGEHTVNGLSITDGVYAELQQAEEFGHPTRLFSVDVDDQSITPME